MRASRRAKVVATVAACVVLAVAIVTFAVLQPWRGSQTGDSSGGAKDATTVSGQDSSQDDAGSQFGAGSQAATGEWAAEGDWVVQMFRNLAPMVGSGEYRAWSEVDEGSQWDFRVSQPDGDGGESAACFAFSDEYAEMAARTSTPLTVAAFCEATNAKSGGGGEQVFSASSGEGAYVLQDSGGEPVACAVTDALRDLAATAASYAASWKEPGEAGGDSLEEQYEGYDWIAIGGTIAYRGKIRVLFSRETDDNYIRSVVAEEGCEVESIKESSGFDAKYVVVVVPEGEEEPMIESFRERADTNGAGPIGIDLTYDDETSLSDVTSEPQTTTSPTSIDTYLQYYLRYSGFEEAWDTVTCDGRVTVGIIDTGIDWENAELCANVDTGRMRNEVEDVTGPEARMDDEDRGGGHHGTHVASVVSSVAGDGCGCDGASHNARVLPVKITDASGSMTEENVLDAYRYLIGLEDPPEVINLSISRRYCSKEEAEADDYVVGFQSLVDRAWSMGIVTVAASGNDGDGLAAGDSATTTDAEGVVHPVSNCYSYPACLDHVVSVGALAAPGWLDSEDTYVPHLADFSNTNSDVDIAAYGANIRAANAYPGSPLDWFATVDGTSFSAPQVAAAAALVKAAHPGYTADQVERALEDTAAAVCEADADSPRGGFGAGSLDAAAAVLWSSQQSDVGGMAPSTGGSVYALLAGQVFGRGELQ